MGSSSFTLSGHRTPNVGMRIERFEEDGKAFVRFTVDRGRGKDEIVFEEHSECFSERCQDWIGVAETGYSEAPWSRIDWKPITTAPRDGTRILLWEQRGHGKGRVEFGQWFSSVTTRNGEETHRSERWVVSSTDDLLGTTPTPTHWAEAPVGPNRFQDS